MDTRNLIALGMLLAVVVVALLRGKIDEHAIKEIVLVLGGGLIGVTLPRRPPDKSNGPNVTPLVVVALLLLVT